MYLFLGSLSLLREHAKQLVSQGIRGSTAKTYSSAQKRYLSFCAQFAIDPIPASEDTLLTYIAQLHRDGLKATSIRVYLSAVRAMHIDEGHGNPMDNCFRITKALRGLDIASDPPKQKLPITYNILQCMRPTLPNPYDANVLWSAMTLAFFGCLRAGECTVTGTVFNPAVHVCLGDLTFSYVEQCHCAVVLIKRSKTDSKNAGFRLYLSCTGTDVCFYCAATVMLKLRHSAGIPMDSASPLFLLSSGSHLTKAMFNTQTRLMLVLLGHDPLDYSSHSYRAGSATTAALCGLSDYELKLLGRWSSTAYQRYIRAPQHLLASFSRRLAHPQTRTVTLPWDTYCKNLFMG